MSNLYLGYDLYAPIKGAPSFTLHELIRSTTAEMKGIDNRPTKAEILENLEYVAVMCLQPVRDYYGVPVIINSGYRSPALNKLIGGSPTSFHSFGQAADIRFKKPLPDLFEFLFRYGRFTELIAEEITVNNGGWIHIAIAKGREKENQLKYKLPGKKVKPASFDEIIKVIRPTR